MGKLIYVRLGVSRTINVNVDSPNLGFPYFNLLGEAQCKKHPVHIMNASYLPWAGSSLKGRTPNNVQGDEARAPKGERRQLEARVAWGQESHEETLRRWRQ